MKKIKFIVSIILMSCLVFACIACTGKNNPSGENNLTPGGEKTVYDLLNEQLRNVSYPFTLTTKVTEDGDVFNGTYTVTEAAGTITVDYSYEKLSAYTTVNGELVAPDSYKTTVTGSAKISDGKVIEQNGATVNLSAEAFNVAEISLSEDNFTDVQMGDGRFSAKISSLQSFAGLNISVKDASISIAYNETKITKMVLTYSTASYQSEVTYVFN